MKSAPELLAMLVLFIVVSAAPATADTVRVGIKQTPPFAMLDAEGNWSGISVELWEGIAQAQGWDTRWVVLDTPRAQIDALVDGTVDVAVGALSLSAEREAVIDFSNPFFTTGLAIAAPAQRGGWLGVLGQLFSPAFLSAVGVLALLLGIVGVLVWLAERKRNPNQFGGSVSQGIGSGFWWSAVTMTTVGYGDKAPVTLPGRVMATIWMFASVITISSFTAAIASSITVDQLSTAVRGVSDLARIRTAVVDGSTAQTFLDERGYAAAVVETPEAGLALLRSQGAAAMLQDEPLLRYLLKDDESGIQILPLEIDTQYYAIGLRPGFEHREMLNRALEAQTGGSGWEPLLNRYLGAR